MNKKHVVITLALLSVFIAIITPFVFKIKQYVCVENFQSNGPTDKELKKQSPLFYPQKICLTEHFIKHQEPVLFVSDTGHHRIAVISLDGSIIATIGSGQPGLLDGNFDTAQFHEPHGVLWDTKAHVLYVADTNNHALRKIDFMSNTVSTIAGTGIKGRHHVSTQDKPTETALSLPTDLAFFPDASTITIAQSGTHQLWLYEVNKKRLRILAGNGREGSKDGALPYNTLAQPSGIAAADDELYFIDTKSHSLRRFKQRKIETLLGNESLNDGFIDGNRNMAKLHHPHGVAIGQDCIYIADTKNHVIRCFDTKTQKLSTLIGNGKPGKSLGSFDKTCLNEPNGLIFYDKKLWIIDTSNHRIIVADLEKKECYAFF